jgi:hypothetical protein
MLEHFNWELFDHPPYNPDLAPSGYHFFTHGYLKNWFNSNEELMEGVKTWLSSQTADFFERGIKNVFPNATRASVPGVTTFRSSLSLYVYFLFNTFFLIAYFVNNSSEITFEYSSYISESIK